jgi:hypothetical protein
LEARPTAKAAWRGQMNFTRVMCKSLKNNKFWRRFRRGFDGVAKAGFGARSIILLALVFRQFSALASGSVTLAWNPVGSSTIAGYNIYYGGVSGVYTNKISVGKATTEATISGLIQGTTYYFAATTYAASGVESARSSQLAYLIPLLANQSPTLNAIDNLTIAENTGLQTVSLSDITSGAAMENQTLTVTATSCNTDLIPNPTVNYTSPNNTGSLSFTPVHHANGMVFITVTVNDGQTGNNSMTRTFSVTVTPSSSQNTLINPLTNQVAVVGQSNVFRAIPASISSLTYQWKFNGSNLPAATGSALALDKINPGQAGAYSVTADHSGEFTISSATLTVNATTSTLAPAAHVSGQYALTVAGVTGLKFVVQASTNLIDWIPVQTNTAPFTFVDVNAAKYRQRFYRSVYIP